jgi:FAD dependent monooxygenase
MPRSPRVAIDKIIGFTTRFACVYGISTALPGISEGQCFSVYRKEASTLIFTGKEGIVFWFVFEDLGEELPYEKTPRFKDDDIEATCQSVIHLKLTEEIEFGDIYARKTVATKIALEEGVAETWHHDRLVIVGDAAHKVSPLTDRLVKLLLTERYQRWSRTQQWVQIKPWNLRQSW